jgi:hypothetical protein
MNIIVKHVQKRPFSDTYYPRHIIKNRFKKQNIQYFLYQLFGNSFRIGFLEVLIKQVLLFWDL